MCDSFQCKGCDWSRLCISHPPACSLAPQCLPQPLEMRKQKAFKLEGMIKDILLTCKVSGGICVLLLPQFTFLLWQYRCATNWEPRISVARAEEANCFVSRRETGYCTEEVWLLQNTAKKRKKTLDGRENAEARAESWARGSSGEGKASLQPQQGCSPPLRTRYQAPIFMSMF